MILRTLIAGALAAAAFPASAAFHPGDREQDAAFHARQQGRFLPLRTIEARIVPQMRGYSYLGPELDGASGRYRLKFMRGPQVVWVDVDARTGAVVGKSGF